MFSKPTLLGPETPKLSIVSPEFPRNLLRVGVLTYFTPVSLKV